MPGAWSAALVFVLGLAVGSFLNVVRYRLPRKLNLVSGRSACPGCNSTIAWYDNVPVVSFLALRRRCRRCGWKIPWIYPVVELATAVVFLLVWREAAPDQIAPYLVLSGLLVASAGIDFDLRIIPDALTLPGIALGSVLSLTLLGSGSFGLDLTRLVLGIVVGGGSLAAIALAYRLVRKIEGLGGGDIKLMAMVGAFLGWAPALLTIFLGSLAGGVFGVALAARRPQGLKTAVPFGVFLAPAAVVAMLWGGDILGWYLGLVRGPR
jgi:leader peptidase (prepilin peptidase)/N-methyltransferase